jgi:hypothetical protein
MPWPERAHGCGPWHPLERVGDDLEPAGRVEPHEDALLLRREDEHAVDEV